MIAGWGDLQWLSWSRKAAGLIFVLVLLGLAAYGLSNYNALLNADSYAYLSYARDLSRGSFTGEYGFYEIFEARWPETGGFNLHSGLRHLANGQIYYGIEAGYPLLLGAVMRCFGFDSAHLVNPFLLLVLAAVYFCAVRLVFASRTDRDLLAAISLLVLLLLPPQRVFSSAMKIGRDLAPLAFLLGGFLCLLLFFRKQKTSPFWLFFSSVLLGAAALMRLTYALFFFPLALYLALELSARRPPRRTVAAVLAAALGLAVFFLPLLAMDISLHRDLFFTIRMIRNYLRSFTGAGNLFQFRYLALNGVWYLDFIFRTYGPLLLLCALVGVGAARKNKAAVGFLLPVLFLQLALFSVFRYKHSRYILPVYAILAVFISSGFLAILQWLAESWQRLGEYPRIRERIALPAAALGVGLAVVRGLGLCRSGGAEFGVGDLVYFVLSLALLGGLPGLEKSLRRGRLPALTLVGVFVVFAAEIVPSSLRDGGFQVSDVRHLRREIEKHTPPGSLIIATRYLKQNLDMYTHCYSLNARQVGGPWGLEIDAALRKVMAAGVEVFLVDNRGFRNNAKYVPFLENYFQLVPAARWKSADLRIHQPYYSSGEYLTLYRVLPPSDSSDSSD